MKNAVVFELIPVYSRQKSFYGKAQVIQTPAGTFLKSYNTIVCGIPADTGLMIRYWAGWSATTARHVAEFSRLHGMPAPSKSDWVTMPVERCPLW